MSRMILDWRKYILQKMFVLCSLATPEAQCKFGVTSLKVVIHCCHRLSIRYITTAISTKVRSSVVGHAAVKSRRRKPRRLKSSSKVYVEL